MRAKTFKHYFQQLSVIGVLFLMLLLPLQVYAEDNSAPDITAGENTPAPEEPTPTPEEPTPTPEEPTPEPVSLNENVEITVGDTVYTDGSTLEMLYTGSAVKPIPQLKTGDTILTENTDYTLSYGTFEQEFLASSDEALFTNVSDSTLAVMITGIGSYTDTRMILYKLTPVDLGSDLIQVTAIKDKIYSGKAFKPTVTMTYNGIPLVRKADALPNACDFSSSHRNNINAGTATIHVIAESSTNGVLYTRNFVGSRDITYTILPRSMSDSKITYSHVANKVYTGKARTPAVTVTNTAGSTPVTMEKNTDYTVTYSDNTEVGTAAITFKGKGNYGGTEVITFDIKPRWVTLLKLISGKGQVTAKWSAATTDIDGYRIMAATNKKFTANRRRITTKNLNLSRKVAKLISGKKYYVRVRTYKLVDGIKYFSKWSNVKTITIK